MKALSSLGLNWGLMNIPLEVYSIRDKTDDISFSSLSECCSSITKLKRTCSKCGKEQNWKTDLKGFKVGKEEYIKLSKAELEQIEKGTNGIKILNFVPIKDVDENLLSTPYYLKAKDRSDLYSALIEILKSKNLYGVCVFVLKQNEHLGILKAYKNLLYIQLIEKNKEIIPMATKRAEEEIITLLSQLVDKNTLGFDMSRYKLNYQDKLKVLIRQKAEGKELITVFEVKEENKDSKEILKQMLGV